MMMRAVRPLGEERQRKGYGLLFEIQLVFANNPKSGS
jgi:hypothetical protein